MKFLKETLNMQTLIYTMLYVEYISITLGKITHNKLYMFQENIVVRYINKYYTEKVLYVIKYSYNFFPRYLIKNVPLSIFSITERSKATPSHIHPPNETESFQTI